MTYRNFQVVNLEAYETWAEEQPSTAERLLGDLEEFADYPSLGTVMAAHCNDPHCEVIAFAVPQPRYLRSAPAPWSMILADRFAKTLTILKLFAAYEENEASLRELEQEAQSAVQALIAKEKYYGS